ncbi:unnamed protein product, partial [Closterium sp. NIES-53]
CTPLPTLITPSVLPSLTVLGFLTFSYSKRLSMPHDISNAPLSPSISSLSPPPRRSTRASPHGGQTHSPSDPTPTMQCTPLQTSTTPSAPPSLLFSLPGKPPPAPTPALFTARSPPGGKLRERRRNLSGCWVSVMG